MPYDFDIWLTVSIFVIINGVIQTCSELKTKTEGKRPRLCADWIYFITAFSDERYPSLFLLVNAVCHSCIPPV